jgi:hypothetical protein
MFLKYRPCNLKAFSCLSFAPKLYTGCIENEHLRMLGIGQSVENQFQLFPAWHWGRLIGWWANSHFQIKTQGGRLRTVLIK